MSKKRKSPAFCRICTKPPMQDCYFCAEHELLWIAETREPSYKIPKKLKRRFNRFVRKHRPAMSKTMDGKVYYWDEVRLIWEKHL